MVLEKFVNKKNSNLPPRPKPPSVDQIMHDLKNTNELGVLVDFHPNDPKEGKKEADKKIGQNPNMNDPEQVYQLVKSYLDTNKKLSELADQIVVEETKLYDDTRQMKQLAEDFKKQAHDALLK